MKMELQWVLAIMLQVALVQGWGRLTCPDKSWKLYGNKCIKPFTHQASDWYSAKKICKRYNNGDLVEIFDSKMQGAVKSVLDNHHWYWIGANDLVREGYFVFGKGKPVTYKPWRLHEPNDYHGCEDCVYMHGTDGLWNDFNCNSKGHFVCQSDAFLEQVVCPEHWVPAGQHCIRAFNTHRNWRDAQKHCTTFGGHLVEITNHMMNAAVNNQLKGDTFFWIGLNDLKDEGKYVWVDSVKPLSSYTLWDHLQPNDYCKSEDCVLIATCTGLWNDYDCRLPTSYVCQIDGKEPPLRCPFEGWTRHGAECFRSFNKNLLSWEDAEKHCEYYYHGHLAEIPDKQTNEVIRGMLSSNLNGKTVYWIGATDKKIEGKFVWANSGKPVTYNFWDKYQPDNYGNCEHCADISATSGRWNDYNCQLKSGYVCQTKAVRGPPVLVLPPPLPPKKTECPLVGWHLMGETCVKAFADHPVDFKNARWACQERGAHLVQIRNKGENDFVKGLVKGHGRQWIGVFDSNKDRQFEYVNGDMLAATFQPWSNGEPNNKGGVEYCVEMFYNTGHWNDQECSDQIPFVCQIDARVPTYRVRYECPHEWTLYHDRCIRTYNKHASWTDARTSCQRLSGDLVQITNDYKNQRTKALFDEHRMYWIGAYDSNHDRVFETVGDNKPLRYADWNLNEPNDLGGKEDCVEFFSNHKWNDETCTSRRAFVCEKDAKRVILPPV